MSAPRIDTDELQRFCRDLLELWDGWMGPELRWDHSSWPIPEALSSVGHAHLNWFVVASTEKAGKTFRGVCLLSERGLGSDAMTLCRSMIESYCNFLYVVELPEQWAQRYGWWVMWAEGQRNTQWNALLENKVTRPRAEAVERASRASLLEEFKAQVGEPPRQGCDRPPWCDVEAFLKARESRSIYDGCYRSGSAAAHGSDLLDHARPTSAGIEVDAKVSPELALLEASGVFLDILGLANRVVGAPPGNNLAASWTRLRKLAGMDEDARSSRGAP